MTSAPAVSIIIVTWNVRELALACIESIGACTSPGETEVILVDNASTDGTVEAVAERFPHVRIVANAGNAGFPRANNQGVRIARGRHVLFLNPDTELRPGTVDACVRALDADRALGAVGCRIELPDGRVQYEGGRSTYRLRHLVCELFYLHMVFQGSRWFDGHRLGHWDHRSTRDVEALSGAFIMTPRALLTELGGLPDELFMYHEDLAYCLRVNRAGRRLRYLGDVSILHYGGSSARRSPAQLRLLEAETKWRLIREADGAAAGALARGLLAVRAATRLLASALGLVLPRSFTERYPSAFDARAYALQLAWCVAPFLTLRVLPRAEPAHATVIEPLP